MRTTRFVTGSVAHSDPPPEHDERRVDADVQLGRRIRARGAAAGDGDREHEDGE